MKAVAVLIAVLTLSQAIEPYAQAPSRETRRGIVRGDRHAFVDDGGPFLARGATLFWGLWGYQHDRTRLSRNLAMLRDWGIDYVRVLGVVGAPDDRKDDSWRDRRADPRVESYGRDIAEFTDWAYAQFGIRVQWTIFGGVDLTPSPEARKSVVERFAAMAAGREEKIFAIEIANEAWQNGFGGDAGRAELHTLAQTVKSKTKVLVALSAPQNSSCEAAQSLYRGSAADLLTLHFARAGAEGGAIWRTFGEPWAFGICEGVPALRSSNEPIGPESSVASLDDPAILAALAAVTYGAGVGAFVFHTGPGVRGGGAADLARQRHSNFWELPSGARISNALSALVSALPRDFSNWERVDVLINAATSPVDVSNRQALEGLYCFHREPRFICVAFGIKQPVTLITQLALTATLKDLVTGASTPLGHLALRRPFLIPATAPVRLMTGSFE